MLPSNQVQIQGQGVVNADNFNTYIQWCDSVADLRNFIGLGGMTIYLQGTAAPADGGQGDFYWNETGTAPDDGGVTTVVPNGSGSGCWTRIPTSIAGIGETIREGTATGTNTIAVTLFADQPPITAYEDFQVFGFTAANTSTGIVTINIENLGAKNAYAPDGITQVNSGDLTQNSFYLFVYNSLLNGSLGGFQAISQLSGGSGTVNTGIGGQVAIYTVSGTAVSGVNTLPNTVIIEGTATNNSASTGIVGEIIESEVPSGSAILITGTFTGTNVTSISLTAGDWDVWGIVNASVPASTTMTILDVGITQTSATIPVAPNKGGYGRFNASVAGISGATTTTVQMRQSLAATTVIYLVTQSSYSGSGAPSVYGYIGARRVR